MEERLSNIMNDNSKEHKLIMVKIDEINDSLEKAYVTKSEFTPVQKIVYGIVGIILTGVFGALLKLTIK